LSARADRTILVGDARGEDLLTPLALCRCWCLSHRHGAAEIFQRHLKRNKVRIPDPSPADGAVLEWA
jgi:hypothetical protein